MATASSLPLSGSSPGLPARESVEELRVWTAEGCKRTDARQRRSRPQTRRPSLCKLCRSREVISATAASRHTAEARVVPARLIMHGARSCGRVRWDVHPEDARHIAHGKGAPGQFRQEQLLLLHCLVLLRLSRDHELAPQVDEALCGVLLAAPSVAAAKVSVISSLAKSTTWSRSRCNRLPNWPPRSKGLSTSV